MTIMMMIILIMIMMIIVVIKLMILIIVNEINKMIMTIYILQLLFKYIPLRSLRYIITLAVAEWPQRCSEALEPADTHSL